MWSSNQGPHAIRDAICHVLALPQPAVRVITPAVGGGFGLKDHAYEDELMVVAAALRLGRPVKWIEDRSEAMVATHAATSASTSPSPTTTTVGSALSVTGVRNTGAHFSDLRRRPAVHHGRHAPGPYRWGAVRVVGTSGREPHALGAYRGFGQTQAALVRERSVDLVAAALGRDPVDLRLQNMLGPDRLPHTTSMFLTYDNGDYPAALRRAASWRRRGRRRRRTGGVAASAAFYVQLAGLANSSANEAIGLMIGGFETSTVEMLHDGSVLVISGISPHGQGLETTVAQLVADRLGVDLDRVELVTGDTASTPYSVRHSGVALLRWAGERRCWPPTASLTSCGPSPPTCSRLRPRTWHWARAAHVAGTAIGVPITEIAKRAWLGTACPMASRRGSVRRRPTTRPVARSVAPARVPCRGGPGDGSRGGGALPSSMTVGRSSTRRSWRVRSTAGSPRGWVRRCWRASSMTTAVSR